MMQPVDQSLTPSGGANQDAKPLPRADAEKWYKRTHPDYYDPYVERWDFVDALYSGVYADPENVTEYLVQRHQGESDGEYAERCELTDPDLTFSTVINELAGELLAVDKDTVREPAPEGGRGALAPNGYGDETQGAPYDLLKRDADGMGTDWAVFWRRATVKQLLYQELPFLVEGVQRDASGRAVDAGCIKIIRPQAVIDRDYSGDGRLVYARVVHAMTERETPRDPFKSVTFYTEYELDGWRRYRVERGSNGGSASGGGNRETLVEVGSGEYAFFKTPEDARRADGRQILPLYFARLPFDQLVSYLLARKALALFNMESQADWHTVNANTRFRVDENADTLFDKNIEEAVEGQNVLQSEPGSKVYYLTPDVEPVRVANERVEAKRRALRQAAYRQYSDRAREATATEIRQERRSGTEAFLTLLAATMDEAESRAVYLLEQVNAPNSPDMWLQARVERSRDFMLKDEANAMESVAERAFGRGAKVPLGAAGRTNVAIKYAETHGISADAGEIEAEVKSGGVDARFADLLSPDPDLGTDDLDPELTRRLREAAAPMA